MYVRPSHQPRSAEDVLDVIRSNMFATLVTTFADGMIASHLPFLLDEQRGERGTLLAHMAAANPQTAAIGDGSEVLVIFSGPHAYVSPSWYADRATAPTWDYVAVHCYGRSRRHSDEEARQNIERLVAAMEGDRPNGWSMNELTPQEVAALLRNVVSFEIPVARLEAKFKLNQGELPGRTRAAIEQLEREGSDTLAGYMRRYNGL